MDPILIDLGEMQTFSNSATWFVAPVSDHSPEPPEAWPVPAYFDEPLDPASKINFLAIGLVEPK